MPLRCWQMPNAHCESWRSLSISNMTTLSPSKTSCSRTFLTLPSSLCMYFVFIVSLVANHSWSTCSGQRCLQKVYSLRKYLKLSFTICNFTQPVYIKLNFPSSYVLRGISLAVTEQQFSHVSICLVFFISRASGIIDQWLKSSITRK